MAVIGTYCEICGLPVQLDHYVPAPDGGWWIWRDDGSADCDPVIAFGADHAWLSRAVALPWDETLPEPVVEGAVHDGCLETTDGDEIGVFPDIDDRGAAHYTCWQLAGRPNTWQALKDVPPSKNVEKYQQQLFDFQACVDDGQSWMLADPGADTPDGRRSRQRILDLLHPNPGG